jgi:hypothetical protein
MSNSIGDLNNSGLKGNNWPWQYRVLLGLDGILSALQNNDEDIEVAYVIEKCPGPPATARVLLEVRVWDASSNTWGTIRYYLPGSNTPLPAPVPAPGCTLEYVGVNDIRPLTCTDQITVCGTSFTTILGNSALNVNVVNPIPLEVLINQANDSILVYGFDGANNQPISVTSGGAVNIRPLTCTDKVSLCFNDGVSDVTVSSTNPLPVNATVTIPNPLPVSQDATSNPWIVDATGSDVTVSNTVTVQATALDIRQLDCATDSVKICEGGNDLGVGADGSIAVNLIDSVNGTQAVVNPDGTQNNAIYGYDHTTLQNEAITSTDVSPTVQALDVKVAGTVDVTQNTVPWVVSPAAGVQRLPFITRVTGGGTIAPGARSFSIFNAGSAPGSILGGVNNLLPGEEVDFVAGGNDVFGLINFNGNGVTTLVVTYVS